MGSQDNTHFFIKVKRVRDTSAQIYNVLVNDNWIIENGENVIIYEYDDIVLLNNDSVLMDVFITIIQHSTKEKILRYQKDNLELMYSKLLNANRNEMYVIIYDETFNVYKSYIIDDKDEIYNIKKCIFHKSH